MKLEEIRQVVSSLRESSPQAYVQSICDKLDSFINQVEAEHDMSQRLHILANQIDKLNGTVDHVTNRISKVETALDEQQTQLFLSQQNHEQMVKAVHHTLQGIDQYLRKHT
jgi:predicted  nucleic acid-binding Zn-ribbon protein